MRIDEECDLDILNTEVQRMLLWGGAMLSHI
jgi:hypothetical protein